MSDAVSGRKIRPSGLKGDLKDITGKNSSTSTHTQPTPSSPSEGSLLPYDMMKIFAFLQNLFSLESVEYCHLSFECSLFGFALTHMILQQYNLHKTNLYAWEYTGLCISVMALLRRLVLKVFQSAKMHQDAQEELWARRLMDAQATAGGAGLPAATLADFSPLSVKDHRQEGASSKASKGKLSAAEKYKDKGLGLGAAFDEKTLAVPQIRALAQRRQVTDAKNRRRLIWIGCALFGIYAIIAVCSLSILFNYGPFAAPMTALPALVFTLFYRRANSWGGETPRDSTVSMSVFIMVVRRHFVCVIYTAMSTTFYVAVLPVLLVSPHSYFSMQRCEFTAMSVFVNTLVLLLAQGFYKGVPMYATARMHSSIKEIANKAELAALVKEGACVIHDKTAKGLLAEVEEESGSGISQFIVRFICSRPDSVQRTLVVVQIALIGLQTWMCVYSVAWDAHFVMLIWSYVILHHFQQCRHDLISSPIMTAVLNHYMTIETTVETQTPSRTAASGVLDKGAKK